MPPELRQSHIEEFCYHWNSQHRAVPACARPHPCCFAQQEVVEISSESDICSVHSPASTAQQLDMSSSIDGLQGCTSIPIRTQFFCNAWIRMNARQGKVCVILSDRTFSGIANSSRCGAAHSSACWIPTLRKPKVSKAQLSPRTIRCRILRLAWFTTHCPAKHGSLGLRLQFHRLTSACLFASGALAWQRRPQPRLTDLPRWLFRAPQGGTILHSSPAGKDLHGSLTSLLAKPSRRRATRGRPQPSLALHRTCSTWLCRSGCGGTACSTWQCQAPSDNFCNALQSLAPQVAPFH